MALRVGPEVAIVAEICNAARPLRETSFDGSGAARVSTALPNSTPEASWDPPDQIDGEGQRQGAGALAVAMLSETAKGAIPDQRLSFDAFRQSAQVVEAFSSASTRAEIRRKQEPTQRPRPWVAAQSGPGAALPEF